MSNHQHGYGKTSIVPTLDRLRASTSVIDRGSVILVDKGLAFYTVPAYRMASKALAHRQSQPGYDQTYLAIIEWLADEYSAARHKRPAPVKLNVVAGWRRQERPAPVFGMWQYTPHELALLYRLSNMHELAWLHGDSVRAAKLTALKIQLYERVTALVGE